MLKRFLLSEVKVGKLVKTFVSGIVLLFPAVAIIGAYMHNKMWTSLSGEFAPMHFTTALMFILVSPSLLYKKLRPGIAISVLVLLFFSVLEYGDVEQSLFFGCLEDDRIMSVGANIPSIGTLMTFAIIAIYFLGRKALFYPYAIIAISGFAIFGYLADIPSMYYYSEYDGVFGSSAMGLLTAIVFFHIGGVLAKEQAS